jgi:hypothetical protein
MEKRVAKILTILLIVSVSVMISLFVYVGLTTRPLLMSFQNGAILCTFLGIVCFAVWVLNYDHK